MSSFILEIIYKHIYSRKILSSYDLVVTVCEAGKETCPIFSNAVKTIHFGFEDPSGKALGEYEKTYDLIGKELLPVIEAEPCK